MKINKILMPTDFSETSEAAIDVATTLAKTFGAELILAHVVEPIAAYVGNDVYVASAEVDEDALTMKLDALAKEAESVILNDINVRTALMKGDVAQAIVELAQNECTDLIVIGTHGRTGVSRLVMGSVAESVMRKARCPVLSYKQTENLAVQ